MKKLILLTSFLMLSLNSFSQIDTTRISLQSNIARLVAKDLIRYDGCSQELKLTQEKVGRLEEKDSQKDVIITLLNDKVKNNQFIIGQKDSQIKEYDNMTKDLKKEIGQTKTKTFLYKVGTFVGILTTSYLLLLK